MGQSITPCLKSPLYSSPRRYRSAERPQIGRYRPPGKLPDQSPTCPPPPVACSASPSEVGALRPEQHPYPKRTTRFKASTPTTGSQAGETPTSRLPKMRALQRNCSVHPFSSREDLPCSPGAKPHINYTTGRGYFASTIVEIPPRGRKSPTTCAQTGSQDLTTSSST